MVSFSYVLFSISLRIIDNQLGGIADAVGVVAKGGSSALWADSYAKAHDLVSKMTLVEKGRIGSVERLEIRIAYRVSYLPCS